MWYCAENSKLVTHHNSGYSHVREVDRLKFVTLHILLNRIVGIRQVIAVLLRTGYADTPVNSTSSDVPQ